MDDLTSLYLAPEGNIVNNKTTGQVEVWGIKILGHTPSSPSVLYRTVFLTNQNAFIRPYCCSFVYASVLLVSFGFFPSVLCTLSPVTVLDSPKKNLFSIL